LEDVLFFWDMLETILEDLRKKMETHFLTGKLFSLKLHLSVAFGIADSVGGFASFRNC
tara:strand:+ start:631 stop:804 length:174 start_codon:yes stop_codon:yes gene_type:complete